MAELEPAVHRVVAFVPAEPAWYELGCAGEIFGAARRPAAPGYEFRVVAWQPGPLPAAGALEELVTADTILLLGSTKAQDRAPTVVVNALRRAHAAGTRLVGLTTGVLLLAQTGLLAGREIIVTRRTADLLAGSYPQVPVTVGSGFTVLDHLAVSARRDDTAGLLLHLVRQDFGLAGTSWEDAAPAGAVHRPDHALVHTLDWVNRHLSSPLSVRHLAARSGVSARTLARQFARDLGVSPARWLLEQRLNRARTLLEETDLTVEAIAQRVGLSSAANLRRRFRQQLLTTPGSYRATHRSA